MLRVEFFSADGRYLHTSSARPHLNLPLGPSAPQILFADGTGYTMPLYIGYPTADSRRPLLLVDREGVVLDTIGWQPLENGSVQLAVGPSTISLPHPFPQTSLFVISDDGRHAAIVERPAPRSAEVHEFRVLRISLSGDTISQRTYRYRPIEIPDAKLDSVIGSFTGVGRAATGRRRSEDEVREAMRDPLFYPPVSAAFFAEDGRLWLQREPVSKQSRACSHDSQRRLQPRSGPPRIAGKHPNIDPRAAGPGPFPQ